MFNMKPGRPAWPARAAFVLALALASAAPVLASADGQPRLDPSNGTTGTDYIFVMLVSARSMDPSEGPFLRTFRGRFTLLQDAGTGEFDVVNMTVDTDNDGLSDRTLSCDGRVGRGRFGMRCSEDDGLEDVRVVIAGRAVVLTGGRLALRKASGRGFTEDHILAVAFAATEQ